MGTVEAKGNQGDEELDQTAVAIQYFDWPRVLVAQLLYEGAAECQSLSSSVDTLLVWSYGLLQVGKWTERT